MKTQIRILKRKCKNVELLKSIKSVTKRCLGFAIKESIKEAIKEFLKNGIDIL